MHRGLPPPPGVAPPAGMESVLRHLPLSSQPQRATQHTSPLASPSTPTPSHHGISPTSYSPSFARSAYQIYEPVHIPTTSVMPFSTMLPLRPRRDRRGFMKRMPPTSATTTPGGSIDESDSRRTSLIQAQKAGLAPPTPAEVGLTRMERAPRRRVR